MASGCKKIHKLQVSETECSFQSVLGNRGLPFRSFEPILRLVPLVDSPASQHWSIWALANLTTVDGERSGYDYWMLTEMSGFLASKYCQYVVHEGGMPLLEQVVSSLRTSARVRELAKAVLVNVKKW